MPTYSLESPQTGQKYQVQFDGEPSPADLEFAAQHFDNEWWKQQGIEPGSAITQQTPLETVGNAIANVGPNLVDMVGGGMRYLDKAAQVVADVTGTQRGGLFADVAKQAEGIKAEGDVLRPLSPANPMAQAIGGGASQGIGLMATAAASVPALGARGLMAVPAVLGFGAGGGAGVQQAEQMGITSPAAQLGMGTAFGAAEAGTEALGGIGGAFFKPAKTMLGRMAGGVLSEGIEEPAAGALQDAITNVAALAVADPKRPGFTTTGFQIPGPAGYLERRGQEAIGGLAGGLVFAGMQPLMRAPGVGQPLSEAPASAPDAVPESTGDLTAADVADLETLRQGDGETGKRQPILSNVPDRMARVQQESDADLAARINNYRGFLAANPGYVGVEQDLQAALAEQQRRLGFIMPSDISTQPFASAATQDQPQTITGSNEQTGSEMPVPPPTAEAGAGAGGVEGMVNDEGGMMNGKQVVVPKVDVAYKAVATEWERQNIMDELAARLGLIKVYSSITGGKVIGNQFDPKHLGKTGSDLSRKGYFFTNSKSVAANYARVNGGKVMEFYINPQNVLEVEGTNEMYRVGQDAEKIFASGKKVILFKNADDVHGVADNYMVGVGNEHLIKSANPTELDDNGNLILPSRRLDFSSKDIRGKLTGEAQRAQMGFTNLDTSGRTAGFLNTEILSEAEALVRRGVTSFVQWSQAMVRRFGEAIRAYLGDVWDNVRRNSELGAVMNPLARGPLRAPESGMASASGAAQTPEPSPGGLSEADAEYLDAVNRGDMEKVQRMVDEAAKAAGAGIPKPVSNAELLTAPVFWRLQHPNWALNPDFKSSNQNDSDQEENGLSVWSSLPELLENQSGGLADYARGEVEIVAIHGEQVGTGIDGEPVIRPTAEAARFRHPNLDDYLRSDTLYSAREMADNASELDSIDEFLEEPWKWTRVEEWPMEFDPVTYDDAGNIIPPSRRFDLGPDIRGNINPESSRAAGGTQGFKNLDTSGRTAGFLNTEILSEARQLIADGFTTFANWSQAMVTRFGRGIREFLQGIWQQITSPQTNAAQNVRLGGPQGNAPVSIGAGGFVGGGQASNVPEGQDVTRSRFASPDEAENLYDVQATETMRAESAAWLEANGIEGALAAMEANSPPQGLRIDHLPSLGAQVITRLAKLAENGTEAQRLQADALLDRAGRAWHGKASQEAGRTLQQRAMATDELRGIAPILATKQVLVERADRVLKERFEGGAEGAVQQVKDIDTKASTQAGEELAAQLEGQPDAPELGDNPEVVPVNDSRVAELEKQMQDLREQMVREQTQAESTLAQTTSTWQKIMGVLQAAGGRKSSLLTGAKGKLAAMRKAALARKAARRAEGRLSANPVEDFADDAIIGAAILAEGLVEFTNWSQAIMREVGFRSGQDLRRLYAEASKKYLEALEAEKAAPTKAKGTPKQRQAREKINKAQRTAQNILDSLARRYSDPPLFAEGQRRVNAMRELYKERVKTGMPEAEFVKRAMALGANEGTAGILWEASNIEIDAREIMALEKSRAGLTGYLKKDSPALAKLLDALRKKVAPGMTWAEIFMTLPAEQKARQREIYRRLMLDERLKALNQGERLQLTNELDRAWQRERRKVFVRELEKITGLGKTPKDRNKVKAALPRLLRLMNLGMLNSETFRGAIAQEYGIQQIDAATGAELRKLGEQIQQAPEGLPRRKLEQQLMQRLQNLTGSTMAEVLESWWTASVLSGWRTQMDIALSLANGLEDVTLGSLVTALRTGNARVAKDALFAMLSNLPTAMNEALDHLITGNRAAMRSYDAEVKAALEDGNKLFGNVGRQLLNKGGMAKLPGAFMEFVSRMMTTLDHINSTSTYEGAKAMALARHPELYEKALTISPQDRQAARTQARLELTGGEPPTTRQQRVEETARMKEILDQRVPLEVQAQAREIGLESALQGEPTGVGAWIYRASNALNNVHRQSLSEYEKNRPDNLAGRAVLRALRITSPLVKVLTGTKFVRTVGHSINRSLSYAPGVGLIRFAEKGMQGSAAKADILLAKQLFGTAVGLALLMAFRDGEDDEQGIEGSWRELTPQQKGQLLAEGKQPYSIWTRDAQGKIRTWNYQQWGIAGVLATIGAMEDQRRYNSQGKDDLAILMDGIVSGSMAWTDKTQLTGLQMLMGKDQAASSSPSSSLAGALNKWASTTVGGLVPRIFKDVDMVISPQLRDTSEWWMKWAGQVPMVRELSSGKRVNIFGEDIVLDRGPTSRITQVGTIDPALRTLGRLNERDIWLPDPTQGVRTVLLADGTRRKMTTLEKDRYQRATGAAYRKFITEQGAALLQMDAELARETISKVTERLRRQAAYDAVRR